MSDGQRRAHPVPCDLPRRASRHRRFKCAAFKRIAERAAALAVIATLCGACGGAKGAGEASSKASAAATSVKAGTSSVRSVATSASSRASSASSGASKASSGAPLIQRVRWVATSGGGSLQVFPTSAGRAAVGAQDKARAWREVVAAAHRAGGQAATKVTAPGMQAQFDCHWAFARVAEPDKPSWNLEPWRPVVSTQEMTNARCNPGGPEE